MSGPDASFALPSEWESATRADGSRELRVKRKGGAAAYVFGALTVVYFSLLFRSWLTHHAIPSLAERPVALAPGVFLVALTAWCAFARECWILRAGTVEKRVGIGSWQSIRRCTGDHLEIVERYSSFWSVPYFRLYVAGGEERQFLLERAKPEDLQALSAMIAACTGWRPPAIITARPWG